MKEELFGISYKQDVLNYIVQNQTKMSDELRTSIITIKDNIVIFKNTLNKIELILTIEEYIEAKIFHGKKTIFMFTSSFNSFAEFIHEIHILFSFYDRTIGSDYEIIKRDDRNDVNTIYYLYKQMFTTRNIVKSTVAIENDYAYLEPDIVAILTNYYNGYTGYVYSLKGLVFEYTIDVTKNIYPLFRLLQEERCFNGDLNLAGTNEESFRMILMEKPFECITSLVSNLGYELYDLSEKSIVSFKKIDQNFEQLLKNIENNKQLKLNV
jgi:hypothetical protein